MSDSPLQLNITTDIPRGTQRVKFLGGERNTEHYIIHPRLSYYRLEEKLLTVDAPQLSYRVFYLLASELPAYCENIISYNIKVLATHFRLSDASVYVALGKLLTADVVRKVRKRVLMLDPYIVFSGVLERRNTVRKQWDEHQTCEKEE
jgi:hypothetical protein